MPLYSSDAEDGDDLADNGSNSHELRSLPISIPLRNRNASESTTTSQSTVASNEGSVRNAFAKAPAEDRSKYEKFIDADPNEEDDCMYTQIDDSFECITQTISGSFHPFLLKTNLINHRNCYQI